MDELNPSDIDYPLYEYWIISRYDIRYKAYNKSLLFNQKMKVIIVILLGILNIIRLGIYLYVSKRNTELAWYYFDSLQYFDSKKEFIYIMILFALILATLLIIILNFSPNSDYKLYEIIDAINGYKTFHSIGLYDKQLIDKFKRNFFYLRHFLKSILDSIILSSLLCSVAIFYIKFLEFDIFQLISGLINSIFLFILTLISCPISLYIILFYIIDSYFILSLIKQFNRYISESIINKSFSHRNSCEYLVIKHNELCRDIEKHNKFWKSVYFVLIHTMIPMNAYVLNLLLFSDNHIFIKFVYLIVLTTFLFICLLNVLLSEIHNQISKTFDNLNYFYRRLIFENNLLLKLKVF